jgi:hypothetical protein
MGISTWLDMMFECSGLTYEKANSAATIIQVFYRISIKHINYLNNVRINRKIEKKWFNSN